MKIKSLILTLISVLFCTAVLAQGGKLEPIQDIVTFIYKYDGIG
jgi:hypothetical protein